MRWSFGRNDGWRLPVEGGTLEAAEAVVALGPWAGDLTSGWATTCRWG